MECVYHYVVESRRVETCDVYEEDETAGEEAGEERDRGGEEIRVDGEDGETGGDVLQFTTC